MARPMIQRLWLAWEALFRWCARVHPLVEGESHLFLVATRRYMGRPFTVDGVHVKRFERVIELHFNNEMLLEVLQSEHKSLVGSTVKLLREAKRSLPVLAAHLQSEKFQKERVLYGVTFIHRGVQQFGFHVIPLNSQWIEQMTTWHLRNIFKVVNPNAAQLLENHPDAFVPKLVAISKEQLLQRYLPVQTDVSQASDVPGHATV